jgi:hypothetical protein
MIKQKINTILLSALFVILITTNISANAYQIPEYYKSESFGTYSDFTPAQEYFYEVKYDSGNPNVIDFTGYGEKWENPENIYEKPGFRDRYSDDYTLDKIFWDTHESNLFEEKDWDTRVYGSIAKPDSVEYYRTNSKGINTLLRVYPENPTTIKYETSKVGGDRYEYIKRTYTPNTARVEYVSPVFNDITIKEYNYTTNNQRIYSRPLK